MITREAALREFVEQYEIDVPESMRCDSPFRLRQAAEHTAVRKQVPSAARGQTP